MPKKVIIIGAGVGGLATAARLASRGYQVEVHEKLSRCGGRNNVRERAGFIFDTGPSFVLMPDFFKELFQYCRTDLSEHLSLKPLDISYHIFYPDGKRLTVYHDSRKTKASLEQFQPNAGRAFDRFIAEAGRLYRSVGSLLYQGYTPADILCPRYWPLLVTLKPFQTYWQLARKFFSSEQLRYAFTFESMFIGVSPFIAPAFYSIISYADHQQKIFHPLGGMYRIPLAIEKIARQYGARFYYNSEVVEHHAGTMFRLKNGQVIDGDYAVINADYAYARKHLFKERIPRYDYSCSVYLLYLGLKKNISGLAHHNLFFSSDLRKNLKQIFDHMVTPDDPSFYVHIPTMTDPSLAPAGKDLAYILIPVPNLQRQHLLSKKDEQSLKQYVYKKISNVIGERFEDCIEVEERFYPEDFIKQYNIQFGATFGLAHTLFQSAFFRPANTHPQHRNTYFVGASTQPGGGLPVVIAGSRIVADMIERQ